MCNNHSETKEISQLRSYFYSTPNLYRVVIWSECSRLDDVIPMGIEWNMQMLKSCRKISMTVRSPTLPMGNCVGPRPLRQTCSWIDRYGRPASPPLEYSRGYRYGYPRHVDLCIEPGQSLGLMIRGGVEYNLGIFITGVDKDSVADRAGLMVGDQILEVNGQSFMEVTHDEAVATLKYHKRMSLLVRDVGKVPHSCTAYDRDWDLCSPGSRVAATTRKWAAALQMVEEKARCLLPRPEFTSLCYYTDEYAARHMTIDAFVQVVTELLNTPEKVWGLRRRASYPTLRKTLSAKNPSMKEQPDGSNLRRQRKRKRLMNIGTWNVKSMSTKQSELISEIKRYQMDIVAVTETKKKGNGSEQIEDYIHLYSGVDKICRARAGVSLFISKELGRDIKDWQPINERIIRVDTKLKGYDVAIIAV
nr:unnamed protein product [Callosobruchus chinensis]